METIPIELLVEIFKYIKTPISLILVNKEFCQLFSSPVAKSIWALENFGRIHALFFSVSLGKSFINVDTLRCLLALKANLSRYFTQRLLLQYGQYDNELIKLKLQDNSQEIGRGKFKTFQNSIKTPWSSDISFDVFIYLLNESVARFGPNFPLKGNDIEKFHFLSSGQLPIDQASQIIKVNLNEIRDLIVNQRFTPFPPRPKIRFEDTNEYFNTIQIINREEFPAKDGYENNRHLHIIARAILLESSIVDMWKEIGYYDICRDVNDLVIQGCMLRLFPLNTPVGWQNPSKETVVNQLDKLVEIGFKLTKAAMVNILCFCENRLDIIGDSILIGSFCEVRKEPKPVIIQKCLFEITQVDREVKNKVLDFLRDYKNEFKSYFIFLKTIVGHFFDTVTKEKFDEKIEKLLLSPSSNSNNKLFYQTPGDTDQILLDNNFIDKIPQDDSFAHQNNSFLNQSFDELYHNPGNNNQTLYNNYISQNQNNNFIYQNPGSNNFINQNAGNNYLNFEGNNYMDQTPRGYNYDYITKDHLQYAKDEASDDDFAHILNDCQKLLYDSINKFTNSDIENPINHMRTLTLRSSLYNWILSNFNAKSMVTKLCFHDIILSKVWVDIEVQLFPEKDSTTIVRNCAYEKILSTYDAYCKHHVPFEIFHLQLLRKSNKDTTLKPFFELFLPRVFNIEPTYQYEFGDKETNKVFIRNDNNSQSNYVDSKKWFCELEKEYNQVSGAASSNMDSTVLFRDYVIMIYNRINKEKGALITMI